MTGIFSQSESCLPHMQCDLPRADPARPRSAITPAQEDMAAPKKNPTANRNRKGTSFQKSNIYLMVHINAILAFS